MSSPLTDPAAPTWGATYWPIWMASVLASFLAPEVYALIAGWKDTLSNFVWHALRVKAGQAVTDWTALHFLVGGFLLVFFAWLFFHLVFHIWAS